MTSPFVDLDQLPVPGTAEAVARSELEMAVEAEPQFSEDIPQSPAEFPESDQTVLGLPADPAMDEEYRGALEACYGEGFPLAREQQDEEDWVRWIEQLWVRHSLPVMDHLWLTERNRRMRVDDQWISSQNKGPWREPPKPADQARIVRNVIAPALDQRVELISEQQPGFRVEPEGSQTQANMKRAEAMQMALEYQWRQQRMDEITREACYWNGTDGVAFLHSFFDPDKGPWDEVMVAENGAEGEVFTQRRMPLGDLETEVLRVEQVRVDAGATATVRPKYWVVRKVISLASAIKRYGPDVAKGERHGSGPDEQSLVYSASRPTILGAQQVDSHLLGQETVEQYYVYFERTEYLPEGLQIMCVGKKVIVGPAALGFSRAPLVRWADGSTDAAFYPRPIMNGWVPTQMLINALESRLVESVRKNAGGRIISRAGSIASETLVGGVLSNIEIREGALTGAQDINNVVAPFPSFSVGQDLIEARNAAVVFFEQVSGWNDATRGSASNDQSGRAILAQREAVERIFNPPVRAAAKAMGEWAKVQLAGMRAHYDVPRTIAMVGESRNDLAMSLSSDDFDGAAEVSVNPETLIPLPRTLRLFMLDQLAAEGIITPDEKRKRYPFAFVQNLDSPDKDQHDRAKRVAEAIRQSGDPLIQPGQPYAILWVDDEAIHQDVLERELMLPDDVPMPIRSAATQRWMMLAQQSQAKMGAMPTPGGQPPAGGGSKPQNLLPPGQQPFMGTNPAIASSGAAEMAGANNQDSAAKQFEATAPR